MPLRISYCLSFSDNNRKKGYFENHKYLFSYLDATQNDNYTGDHNLLWK